MPASPSFSRSFLQYPGLHRDLVLTVRFCSVALLILFTSNLSANAVKPPLTVELDRQLRAELTARVQQQFPDTEVSIRFKASPVPHKPCIRPTTEVTAQQAVGRIPIRIRCQGKAPWSFYTYAEVSALQAVVVAAHPIARGSTVTAADVTIKKTPIDPHNSYFTQSKAIIGRLAARNIRADQAIQARQLRFPLAVKRGDRVTIQAQVGRAVIATSGTALKSGHIGEQIPVKNDASQRVIHTWIVAKGLVNTRAVRT